MKTSSAATDSAYLRVIGDVHTQLRPDDLFTPGRRPYLDLIAEAPCSVQIGDMGDGESYDILRARVDPVRHRFFAGNHEAFPDLPPHVLGDFGLVRIGPVEFFFVRGA